MDNGEIDEVECSIKFTIASFVIHDISVNSSSENENVAEIYGYYNREVELDFYFDVDDISYYNPNETQPYWNTIYAYEDGILFRNDVVSNSALTQIYQILKEIV